jgi:hypothetical protein
MASDRPRLVQPLEKSVTAAEPEPQQHRRYPSPPTSTSSTVDMSFDGGYPFGRGDGGQPPSQDHCEDKPSATDHSTNSASARKVADQTVAPFLARHIPEQYAPLGLTPQPSTSRKDPNTKYCYRHRPDSKCRRTADEPTMENLQWVCGSPLVVTVPLYPVLTS